MSSKLRELQEIQDLAMSYDERLRKEFPKEVTAGGNLFLGKHYRASPKIFLSLNPGTYRAGTIKPFEVELRQYNRPWEKPEKYAFWRNCTRFVSSSPGLADWIEDATSTFVIPWRSRSLNDLRDRSELWERTQTYSRDLLRKMVEDHHAKTLIVSGLATVRIVAEFLDFPLNSQTIEYRFDGSGYLPYGIYQWMRVNPSKSATKGLAGETIIYQVPHFSRSTNKKALHECASWLWANISSS